MSPRDNKLDSLSEAFRPLAMRFLARLVEARVPVVIVETRRSEEAHQEDLRNGRSWIQRSKHQDGNAIDVCPYAQYDLHGPDKLQWNPAHPVWPTIAITAEKCGLKSGYRWKQKDCGHVEL